MEHYDDEEGLLRSVALQNAKTILLARQRAEEELVRAKEALELKTQELAHSLAMMRATLESSTDGILVTESSGKITAFNARYVNMWRLARELMESREHRQLLAVTAGQFSDPRQYLAKIDEIYASSLPESYDLLELADGRVFERFSRIQFVEQRDAGRVWSFRDITERTRAVAALEESDRRKDEFLAMLAHELRNPLAPIRNAVQMFRAMGPPVPELQWATEVIDRQVHQMTRLVDDLLDVSRITWGKIELRKERVELAAIVNSAVEASRPLIDKWGHELTVTIPPQPIPLEVDLTRLAQALLNLINNAAKYMERAGRIWVTAERQGGHALIRVKDTGIGIPAEMLPRIFDMFMQVDRSLERAEGGLGIGLTLVQRLVDMHGGTVEARSDGPGKGSEFVVRLPVAAAVEGEGPRGAAGDGESVVAPATRRILVVDDNRDAADSLGMLLRMMGNEVHTAYDGLEALGAVAAFQPDVVLLDIGLPKLNGYEAARRIREQGGGTEIVLIALTGWGQEEDRRRSKEAGFDHHMTKPVVFADLQKLLAETDPSHRRGGAGF